ncbi:MAG: alanine racemase [Candidatus Puniceispirillaceae bacterium]
MHHQHFGNADSAITIDLDAIIANWRYIDSLSAPKTKTAAVVKANGYGLGSCAIATALAQGGCELFFVASLTEAIELRSAFRQTGHGDLPIMVLHGVQRGQEADFATHHLEPVLNDLEQISRWRLYSEKTDTTLPALLHFDTGMNRLGLDADQADWLIQNKEALNGLKLTYVMSHLVSGELINEPVNVRQLNSFNKFHSSFSNIPASIANSAGSFLGSDYHFSMTRPGIALFGIHPFEDLDSPLRPAFDWQVRILQVRNAAAGDKVGYGGTHQLDRDSQIATLGVGYADGYRRQLGGMATVAIGGRTAPVIGRVSMDSITVDVTGFDQETLSTGKASLVHADYGVEKMANDVGTIPYEIMTGLGHRAERHYRGGS